MNKGKPPYASYLLMTPAGVVLFLYGYLGSLTRFLADDFCSAYYAGRLGLLRSIWFWYLTWSGRYSAYAADWLMEKLGAYALPILPPLSLLVWILLTALAIQRALQNNSWVIAFALSLLFLFTILQLSPNIPQSLYWWNGMRAYSLPLIFLTLYSILFQVGSDRLNTRTKRIAGAVASFLFLFAIGGFSETYAAFQVALLGYLLLAEWLLHRSLTTSRFQFLLSGLAGSLLAILIVVLAPGNAIRQSYYPAHPSPPIVFVIALRSYAAFLLDILRTPEKVLALLGGLAAAVWLGNRSAKDSTDPRLPLVSVLGGFLVSFATFVPSAYAISDAPAPRSVIIPVFVLVASLLGAGFLTGRSLPVPERLSQPVVASLFVLALLLTGGSAVIRARALIASREEYIRFAQKWDQTDALILQAKAGGQSSVVIPAMDNWAGLERPTPKKEYWPNVCYSLYYGIQVYGPRYSENE